MPIRRAARGPKTGSRGSVCGPAGKEKGRESLLLIPVPFSGSPEVINFFPQPFYYFRRELTVTTVVHLPSSPCLNDVKTRWSLLLNSVTSLNFESPPGAIGQGPSVSSVRIF